jgi:hypothetical protein
MTDRPTIIPPGIDAPAIHRETNPEAQSPDPAAPYRIDPAQSRYESIRQGTQIEPQAPKARRPRKDTGAASLAFWRALSDAARAKYGR